MNIIWELLLPSLLLFIYLGLFIHKKGNASKKENGKQKLVHSTTIRTQ